MISFGGLISYESFDDSKSKAGTLAKRASSSLQLQSFRRVVFVNYKLNRVLMERDPSELNFYKRLETRCEQLQVGRTR